MMELVTGMSREVMHWQPQNEPTADGWCIDDILEHLARAERVYTSRLSSNIFELLEDAAGPPWSACPASARRT